MTHRTSRRIVIGMAGLAGLLWAGLAQAAPVSFSVDLTGGAQVPPVQSSGSGKADLTYDAATGVVTWSITYNGLSGPATMAHFHGPAGADANAGVVIWLTQKGGAADSPIKGQATLTPDQAKQFAAGQWYINVHTAKNPNGEVRGQVVPPKS
ncbi:MAG TPA: CHRD domain-containing protein [Roseiarcus sp.]|nr:CHRD domain-containing protein [Roseiarcus sp.]